MTKSLEISLIVLAVIAVGTADVLIKKVAASTASFGSAVRNPVIVAVLLLYAIQIAVFTYVFVNKAELGIVGIIQTALYAVIVIGGGMLLFREQIRLMQWVGIGLAIAGVILMNF